MIHLVDAILVLVMALNLFALATSRLSTVIRTVAIQGVLLGLLPLFLHGHLSILVVLVAGGAILIKGLVIPSILMRAMRDVKIKHEVHPRVGLPASMVLGGLATVFALLVAGQLPLSGEHAATLLVPASIATVLVGFVFLTTRLKAISQAIGYLVLDNGVFVFGALLAEAMPLIVEMGVLLDLLVGVFVIGIIVNQINRAFSSQDTSRLASLKE